jgi:signal transduction histidine kinase/ligand-binding sensor domain-containing protein
LKNSSTSHNRGHRLFVLLAALTGFFGVNTAWAVDPTRVVSQYVRDQWGTEQGFPKGPVYAITQTADGYLWIGTEAGLVRFDGRTFRLIKDDSGAFTIASVLGLTASDDGCLWLRLHDMTILRYCKGVFDHPSSDPELNINIFAMIRGNAGQILIAKGEDTVVDPHQGTVAPFVLRGAGFQRLAAATDLPRSAVISMAQTSDGDIWMGTREAGLFRFIAGRTLSVRKGLPDLKVDSLLADGDRNLWVGTDDGIVRWNGSELSSAGLSAELRYFQALALLKDRDGNVWAGTDSRGLLRLNSRGVARLNLSDGPLPRAITALFEGREGGIWVGHADGIERIRDSAFVTWSNAEGLPADGSNPVFVDSANRMWFPPVKGGLWWVKDEQFGRVVSGGLDRDVIYSIDGRGEELWVGRQHGGLTRLRVDQGSISTNTWTQTDGLAQNSVYSVYLSRDGTVWAGTLSAGVSMMRDGRFTNFTSANGLSSNTVAAILESADGTMWFATPGGLSALSRGRWISFGTGDGLPSADVNCLLEDASGTLWVGTASGIAFRGRKGFQVPHGVPGSLSAPILGMAEDRSGSIWVATSSHVLRVNREKLLQGTLNDGDIRQFGLADGLRGLEGVKRNRSVVTDSAGRVWFSLNLGISVVDPGRLTRNSAAPIVHIQTISADGDSIAVGNKVRIPGGRQRITFGYSGLILSVPDRVRYRYRLEGFDRDWSEPTLSREAVYTNLPPSHYRFRVMATNADGIWSPSEGAVAFDVAPLFWQTWWFLAIGILLCLAAIRVLYKMRLSQATARINARFQERLAERTRIAQELHDTLLQGFLSASMQVHVAVDRLPDDAKVKPTLNRALELMRQVIDEGRNAVRGLRSTKSASLDLEHAFSQIRQEFAAGEQVESKIDFRVIVEGEQRPLHPVLRDEVYRIGREALLNAFRHAHAKKIEIELKYSSRSLCILVRDDGRGIDPGFLKSGRDGHWGLSGMRERADRIGARFHVMSSAFAGTEIELSIPGNIAFQDESGHVSSHSSEARTSDAWFGRFTHRVSDRNGKHK